METPLGGGQHTDGIFKLRLRTLALAVEERVQRLGLGVPNICGLGRCKEAETQTQKELLVKERNQHGVL